jgi:hypothetical protein
VHAFACSHTCLPVFQRLRMSLDPGPGERWVLNNGAAGMPNFLGERYGLITRIATRPYRGPERCYGVQQAGVHHEALKVAWDTAAFDASFLQQWPAGTDAHASYFERIQRGPDYAPAQAVRDDTPPFPVASTTSIR